MGKNRHRRTLGEGAEELHVSSRQNNICDVLKQNSELMGVRGFSRRGIVLLKLCFNWARTIIKSCDCECCLIAISRGTRRAVVVRTCRKSHWPVMIIMYVSCGTVHTTSTLYQRLLLEPKDNFLDCDLEGTKSQHFPLYFVLYKTESLLNVIDSDKCAYQTV